MTILLESAIRVTLIAAIIALVLFAMRIKTASVLHAVWASVVVLMLLLPAWVAWGPKAPLPVLPSQSMAVIVPLDIVPPPLPAGRADTPSRPSPVPTPAHEGGGYIAIYLFGVGVFLLRLAIGTIRANRLTSASCVVPVTVGLLHPRIILPENSREWPQAQLDAVLTHEGEHIRRRDPLFQWIALLNRAIFWFHPLAWWLERKLSGLAEEACDAAVIARGCDPREYSEFLLDLARSIGRAGTRVDAVGMAMPGIGLKHRIRRMLSGVPVPRISRPRLACTVAVCAAAAAILAAGTLVRAQSAATAPKFEVASVKACEDGDLGGRSGNGSASSSLGRLNLPCTTVKDLIQDAYVHFANGHTWYPWTNIPIKEGPAWTNSDRYRIEAKAGDPESQVMMNGPMLQAVLEDRFKLKIHRETREIPVYALTVAKGGPKLQPFKEGSCVPWDFDHPPSPPALGQPLPVMCGMFHGTNEESDAHGATTADLCTFLSTRLDRNVIDKTGIAGMFNIRLEVSVGDLGYPVDVTPGSPATPPDPFLVFTAVRAAVQKLGLKLDSAKGPGEFLVIDHVEKPSEN